MKSLNEFLQNHLYYFCIQTKYEFLVKMQVPKKKFNIAQIRKLIFSSNLREKFPYKLNFEKQFEYNQLGVIILSLDNELKLTSKEKKYILNSLDFDNDNSHICYQLIAHIHIQNINFSKYEWRFLINKVKDFHYPQTTEGNLGYYLITALKSQNYKSNKITNYIYKKDLKKIIYNLNLKYFKSNNFLDAFNSKKTNLSLLDNIFSLHEKYPLPFTLKDWEYLIEKSDKELVQLVDDLPILNEIKYLIFCKNIKVRNKNHKLKFKI